MSVDINKTDSEYLLEIRHLRKAFDDLTVLRDISLKVSPREVQMGISWPFRVREIHTSQVRRYAGENGRR